MEVIGGSEILTTSGWVLVDKMARETVCSVSLGGEVVVEDVDVSFSKTSISSILKSGKLVLECPTSSTVLVKSRLSGDVRYTPLSNKITWTEDVVRTSLSKGQKSLNPLVVLTCALQADGSYNTTSNQGKRKPYWEIQMSRERKLERFRHFLKEAGVPHSEYAACKLGKVKFYIPQIDTKYFTGDLREKNFNLSSIIEDGLQEAFLEEASHWDGHIREKGWNYCSTNYYNVGVIQALAHLTGKAANYGVVYDKRPIFKKEPKPYYRLNVSSWCTMGHQSREQVEGAVSCVYHVNTQNALLVRQGGHVFVVGSVKE